MGTLQRSVSSGSSGPAALLHLLVLQDGDQQAKTHAGGEHKAEQSDHRHIVPAGRNAWEHNQWAAHNERSQHNGKDQTVGDALERHLQGHDAPVLEAYVELPALQLHKNAAQVIRQGAQEPEITEALQ